MTSIIYALTLGCIIFLLVTASLEIESITNSNTLSNCDIEMYSFRSLNATEVDPVLLKYKDSIKDFGYQSAWIEQY